MRSPERGPVTGLILAGILLAVFGAGMAAGIALQWAVGCPAHQAQQGGEHG